MLKNLLTVIYSLFDREEEMHTIEVIDEKFSKTNGKYKRETIKYGKSKKKLQEPYKTFAEMREISREISGISYGFYAKDMSFEIFMEQAEHMKDFTDSYENKKPLEAYHANNVNYERMDDEQLRTYFTWRTKVRAGNIEDISLSYTFCYIHELLNHVGVQNATEGLDKLISFWHGFRVHQEIIDKYLAEYIKGYYVVHYANLSDDFEKVVLRYPIPYTTTNNHIENIRNGIWEINFVEFHSSYKITELGFYKKGNKEIIEECLSFVLEALSKLFKENKLKFEDLHVAKSRGEYWTPFRGAGYFTHNFTGEIVKIGEHESYEYKNGHWLARKPNFFVFPKTKGYILKTIEIHMRKALGGQRNLKPQSISDIKFEFTGNKTLENTKGWKKKAYELIESKAFEQTIESAIQNYLKSANITVANGAIVETKPIEIDMSQLERIRDEHLETATKLNTEDDIDKDVIPFAVDIKNNAPSEPLNGFSSLVEAFGVEEKGLITSLLSEESTTNIKTPELIVEQINEKALEAIGDNLIEEIDGKYSIYMEYKDELLNTLEDIHE